MTNKEFALMYKTYVDALRKKGSNIDATNICPIQCPFCPRQNPEKNRERILKSKDISFSNYKKLIKFSDHIRFSGQISDPIYHKDFISLLKETKKYPQKKFSIHTTGTRKKKEWWIKAFSVSGKNVRWIFGLDGASQEIANIYRVNTKFDDVMQAMKLGISMGVEIIWQFIVFKHNEHQVEEAERIALENNITLELVASDRWEPHLVDKYKIYPPENPKYAVKKNGIYVKQYYFLKNENIS